MTGLWHQACSNSLVSHFTPNPDLLHTVYTQENQAEKKEKPMQLQSRDFSTQAPPSHLGVVQTLSPAWGEGCHL